jgi:phosphatidylserine/phosphatidylglycerophosphate/cardiolipin synthase-like enzyme
MDERSMELNEENVLGIADREFARAVSDGVESDFARSREIRLEEWRRRSIVRRALETIAKALIEQY